MAVRVRTLEQAAAWVDDVGIALLFPNGDYVLPSLWEAVVRTLRHRLGRPGRGRRVCVLHARDGEGLDLEGRAAEAPPRLRRPPRRPHVVPRRPPARLVGVCD